MRFIPNENTYVSFSPTPPVDPAAPTIAEITGTGAVVLTGYVSGLNFSTTGSAVPTPSFLSLFETSIPGTVTATATMDAFRDDTDDNAYDALPRGTEGVIYISRYGGVPAPSSKIEVWPIRVTSRSNANLTNNTPVTFTVTFSVPEEPTEDAVVAA